MPALFVLVSGSKQFAEACNSCLCHFSGPVLIASVVVWASFLRLVFHFRTSSPLVSVFAAVNFPYFFFFFVFIELVPCATGADPASHGVRLWRGGSASRVLPHRVSFPRVPLHGHQEVRKRPWPPLWGRGEMATLALRRAQLVSGTSDARCLSVPFV